MSIEWDHEPVIQLIRQHGRDFARMRTLPEMKRAMLKDLGTLRGNCFVRCLQVAHFKPDYFYYCEGYADSLPHAWLSPRWLDEDWALDPTWMWKWNGVIYDDVRYAGIKVDGRKVVEFLLSRKGSSSLMKHIGHFDVKELQ